MSDTLQDSTRGARLARSSGEVPEAQRAVSASGVPGQAERTPPRKRRREPLPPPRAQRGCLGTCALYGGLSLLVMTVLVACITLIITLEVADFVRDPVDGLLALFGFDEDATPQVVDSRTIVVNIKKLAVLETVQSGIIISKTVVDSSAAPDAELSVSYVGTVKAGVDLALVDEGDVVVGADNSVTITLPPAQITLCDLGKPEVTNWTCRGWAGLQDCGSRQNELLDVAYDRALQDLLDTADELDLPGLAMQNAQATLYDLLRKLGYERVEFHESPDVLPVDASCLAD